MISITGKLLEAGEISITYTGPGFKMDVDGQLLAFVGLTPIEVSITAADIGEQVTITVDRAAK